MSEKKSRTARKSGLRDQLARKRAKVITLYFPDGEDGEKAIEALDEAERLLAAGKRVNATKPDKPTFDIPALQQAVDEASARRDEHCIALRVRGLSENERDALLSEYLGEDIPEGADEAERKRILEANNERSREWTYHALATAAQDSDLTVDEWREELTSDRWTAGDLAEIRQGLLIAQGSRPAEAIPKD